MKRRLALLASVAVATQMAAAGTFTPMAPVSKPPILTQANQTDWAALLGSYVTFCKTAAEPQYYVDCLSERFGYAASQMDAYTRDTATLRKALLAASRDLYAITTTYHTADAGEATPLSPTVTPTRALRAIAPQNRAAAREAGIGVLDATELVLLRSADRDPDRALAFSQVAAVIGTAKVLLRAA